MSHSLLSANDDQHQRGRMVAEILAKRRIVALRIVSPSGRTSTAGAPAASLPLPAAGATLFEDFHALENTRA